MSAKIATIACAVIIGILFQLERDRKARASKALWIPVLWLSIAGSRAVSLWLVAIGVWSPGPMADLSDPYVEGSPIDRAVFSMLVTIGLTVLVRRRKRVVPLLRANASLVAFVIYCALSVCWSDYPTVAFKRWIKAIGDIAMVMIVLTEPDPLAAIRRFLGRPTFVLIPLSVLLVKYYPDLGREYTRWGGLPMYSGVTTTKNLLGMICLVFGLGSVWRLLTAWKCRASKLRSRGLIAHGSIVAMVAWLLWMSNSMTSLSCFLLSGSLLLATSFRWFRRRPAVVHLSVGAILAVAFSALFLDVGSGALQTMGRDPTLTGRTAIWELVMSMTGNPWVGTGYESFWLGERLNRVWAVMEGIQEAHNGYIEVFLHLGWLGIGLLAWVIAAGYRKTMKALSREGESAPLMLAVFVAALVYNFTEAGFRMLAPIWIAFLLATIAVPNAKRRTRESPVPITSELIGEPVWETVS